MPVKFIRRGGRTIPIRTSANVKAAVKSAADVYTKHFGKDDPIKKVSNAKLFNTVKTKPGFGGYAAQRVSQATVKGTAKGLRKFGRGSVAVGALAALGTGTALYGAAKFLGRKKKVETPKQ